MTVEGYFMATIQGLPIPPHTVSVCQDDSHVLQIDTESAWTEMQLKAGWSNEIDIKVYISLDV